ncbi:hypothetical protein A3A54_00210 [Candidatus Curtissbacteria bacterium RIFCSPLOWO2_01_FULL_39_62]|uniref:Methyltransferase type 11 domain-containing protein n=2 Tax=Candidatus Curtissiibacteriota TaxID=1752717 RepID=A0A1F5GAR4_9BACT|nr:MAG: hypothetical protein A2775_00870 [Candidatus Curtissbacteria bacterium RIFCSPHIGHO2_01_FULL_39_57]OGD88940.1 MAG: hypothetical protein A3D04_01960 [Candidatus Curtissbacteria bacterium RIFCSPHIGHO2_02_FULL_40_16b]OGD90690.1 MAG: hypothetical protein A3E11_00955 [Candidatus Curtissbacteria bacterium RIFCSPHIGHO2_12_FULL_38_37]OGE00721.1 MAG: hypothetical protein A3J17_04175 [Candidatus Curtissbacteria bacterium RIFCSPLOWO2_02_FULL_40_11]OGE02439.1 MAG: hypothetical protein A3A54_00210 [C
MSKERFTDWARIKPENYRPKVENGVIVEIGPGIVNAPKISETLLRRIKYGAVYIGIDYFADELHRDSFDVGELVVGDLIDLPISSGLVEQIWMMNVFSDGDHKRRSVQYTDSQLYEHFFNELARVLKTDGTVIICDYYGDTVPIGWLRTKDYSRFGFKMRSYSRGTAYQFIEKHGITPQVSDDDPFFITLTKVR